MIVRPRPRGIEYFLVLHGSILPTIWLKLAITVVTAMLVTLAHGALFHVKVILTPMPFNLMGLALAIFLGFRNSASYERFWEGRKLWGALMVASRDLVRQFESFLRPAGDSEDEAAELAHTRHRMTRAIIAYAHALRHHLRGSDPGPDFDRLLPADWRPALAHADHRPAAVLQRLGGELRLCIERAWVAPILAQEIDRSFSRLGEVLGGCERIRSTPIPFSYSVLLHRTVYVYCYLLPFGLIDTIGNFTPLVVGIVAYTFFGLDAIGDEIEEPFGTTANDLPLSALSHAVEADLRELSGEGCTPPTPKAVNYCLQ